MCFCIDNYPLNCLLFDYILNDSHHMSSFCIFFSNYFCLLSFSIKGFPACFNDRKYCKPCMQGVILLWHFRYKPNVFCEQLIHPCMLLWLTAVSLQSSSRHNTLDRLILKTKTRPQWCNERFLCICVYARIGLTRMHASDLYGYGRMHVCWSLHM